MNGCYYLFSCVSTTPYFRTHIGKQTEWLEGMNRAAAERGLVCQIQHKTKTNQKCVMDFGLFCLCVLFVFVYVCVYVKGYVEGCCVIFKRE